MDQAVRDDIDARAEVLLAECVEGIRLEVVEAPLERALTLTIGQNMGTPGF